MKPTNCVRGFDSLKERLDLEMKITKEEDYAILFMSILAVKRDRLHSLQEISDDFNIPYYFLKKIARQLKDAKLVKAKEGAAGGYSLAFPAREITLAEIIEAIRGPLALVDCAEGAYCPAEDFCVASSVLKRVSKDVRQIFAGVRLTDMISSYNPLPSGNKTEGFMAASPTVEV